MSPSQIKTKNSTSTIICTLLLRTKKVRSEMCTVTSLKPLSTVEQNLNPFHKEQRKVCRLSLAQTLDISINPTSTVGLKPAVSHARVNPPSAITDETTSLVFKMSKKRRL